MSGKILVILLDEQVKTLTGEIGERQKQLEMIKAIKERIGDKAIVPANTIIGIENIMENKNKMRSKEKLALIYIAVAIAAALGLSFMVWLVASRNWLGLAAYIGVAIIGLSISAFPLKDTSFICPNCSTVFKTSLRRAFFSTGNHKVRWMTCPECGHRDWCVLRKD